MTSLDCTRCGFMNIPTDRTCFKCGASLSSAGVLVGSTRVDSTQEPYFPPPTHGFESVWRKKSQLVMTKQAPLPDRCVKCNAPAFGRKLKRKLAWHHPALYLLIFIGVLFYAIIAMVVRKTATVHIGLCEDHFAARKRNILITWMLGLLSLVSFVVAIAVYDGTFAAVGCVLILATAIYGSFACRIVTPAKIDNHLVWLNGINSNYLQEFPEWRGTA